MNPLTALILLSPWFALSVPASFAATEGVCPPATVTSGLDVSSWQNVSNWNEVKSSEYQFAFIKAIEGSGANAQDSKFRSDWGAANDVGVLRSAYAYFLPNEDPQLQAAAFISVLEENGVGELPPMLDWEDSNGVSAAKTMANAQIWLDQVENWLHDQNLNWTPIIYTVASYWDTLKAPDTFSRYPLFIADPNHDCPVVPAPWTSWQFWQRKPGKVPGISTATDLDYFSGSVDMLQTLASF